MIDVMLVLLIIFMVVTPALLAGFNAVPPQGQNLKDHPEDAENDQVLGIDRDGNYYLNKKPISKDAIEAEIKRIYDSAHDGQGHVPQGRQGSGVLQGRRRHGHGRARTACA